MENDKYILLIDNEIVAERMSLETATILIKALFNEYYNDYNMKITIRKEERTAPLYAD